MAQREGGARPGVQGLRRPLGRLEQLDRIAVRIFDLNLSSARTDSISLRKRTPAVSSDSIQPARSDTRSTMQFHPPLRASGMHL
jgi:hypothetical protein